jgi:hypothetical protein
MALPTSLAHLIDLIGEPATVALMRAHGGLTYKVPATTRGARYRELADLVGEGAARALLDRYGGDIVYVAKLDGLDLERRNAIIRAAYDARSRAGERNLVKRLAREHDLTERHVWSILGSPPPEPNPTLELFDRT